MKQSTTRLCVAVCLSNLAMLDFKAGYDVSACFMVGMFLGALILEIRRVRKDNDNAAK